MLRTPNTQDELIPEGHRIDSLYWDFVNIIVTFKGHRLQNMTLDISHILQKAQIVVKHFWFAITILKA